MLMPFLDQLQLWAARRPEATAVEVDAEVLTFRRLRDAAEAELAVAPHAHDIEALSLSNGTDFVVKFAAGVAAGRRCAVLDPHWPDPVRARVEQRLLGLCRLGIPMALPPAERMLTDGDGDSVFLYGFTSGTTSVPKAFTRTRESWQLSFAASTQFFGLSADDRTLAPGPFSSSLTLYALCESLFAGAAFISLSSFDVGVALDCLRERAITRLVAVPSALQMMVERDANGTAGAGLSSIVSAGSKLSDVTLGQMRAWAPDATIFEYYGAAELGFVTAAVHRPMLQTDDPVHRPSADQPSTDQATAVGTAFPGVEVRIHDDSGHEQHVGVSGNIVVRSALVSDGYAWGDDGTAFIREGDWCTVGDQGYLDDDGVLHFLGRRADMVTTGGHNVYPHEVEAVLQSVTGVRAAVVTGLPDPRRGHLLVAALNLTEREGSADAAVLRAVCRSALVVPKRPRAYYLMTELPLTASGKVSRNLLARWITEGDSRVRPL